MELLFQDDAYMKSCEAEVVSVGLDGIRLDRTIFYATGGGQPGDSGLLRRADGSRIEIIEARKGVGLEDIVHIPANGGDGGDGGECGENADLPVAGEKITLELGWERRHKHMRMHTAMHVLCSLVEGDVTGGSVGTEKSRLDFNLPDGPPDRAELNERFQAVIAGDHAVGTRWISDEEMAAQADLVRTMSVKPPMGYGRVRLLEIEGIDLQPCGGTHVRSTGEIGSAFVAKIENKGRQNRRFIIRFADDQGAG